MEAKRRRPKHVITAQAAALVAAVGAAALAILALVGVFPWPLTSIASIAIGGGLVAHGAVIANRLAQLSDPRAATEERAKVGEASGDEVLGGTAAIVLGILALVGLEPLLLLGTSAMAIGGALVFAASSRPALSHVAASTRRQTQRAPLVLASVALVLGGLAALTLGVIAVVGVSHALTLVQVSMLVVAGALIVSAVASGGAVVRGRERTGRLSPHSRGELTSAPTAGGVRRARVSS